MRELTPKDIKREFVTGPRKFDKIMEKLEITTNEMMADDGPVPMNLANVGTNNARTTRVIRTRATTCRATMCLRSHGMDTKPAKEQARKEARKVPRAANLMGTVTKTNDPMEAKARNGWPRFIMEE